ncbi:unnamed protein product, partial [Rotaria sp. Silwood2]
SSVYIHNENCKPKWQRLQPSVIVNTDSYELLRSTHAF